MTIVYKGSNGSNKIAAKDQGFFQEAVEMYGYGSNDESFLQASDCIL